MPKQRPQAARDFPPVDRVNPNVGKVWLARNVTTDPERPTFAEPELVADGVYMLGYPNGEFDGTTIVV